ncbi:MAG TPA: NADH-quinone oxidoreductase subunit C, partial [Caulobacteraceae bacterium]|nr:NADH-quinone oxidoreductase subunit C [Caulobacteraceae bacterium]
MDDTLDSLGRTVVDALSPAVTAYSIAHHELTVSAQARDIVSVMRFLRDDPRCLFWNIIDVTAVDWPSRERR